MLIATKQQDFSHTHTMLAHFEQEKTPWNEQTFHVNIYGMSDLLVAFQINLDDPRFGVGIVASSTDSRIMCDMALRRTRSTRFAWAKHRDNLPFHHRKVTGCDEATNMGFHWFHFKWQHIHSTCKTLCTWPDSTASQNVLNTFLPVLCETSSRHRSNTSDVFGFGLVQKHSTHRNNMKEIYIYMGGCQNVTSWIRWYYHLQWGPLQKYLVGLPYLHSSKI